MAATGLGSFDPVREPCAALGYPRDYESLAAVRNNAMVMIPMSYGYPGAPLHQVLQRPPLSGNAKQWWWWWWWCHPRPPRPDLLLLEPIVTPGQTLTHLLPLEASLVCTDNTCNST